MTQILSKDGSRSLQVERRTKTTFQLNSHEADFISQVLETQAENAEQADAARDDIPGRQALRALRHI